MLVEQIGPICQFNRLSPLFLSPVSFWHPKSISAYPSGNTKYKNKLHNILFTDVDVDLNIWCPKTFV